MMTSWAVLSAPPAPPGQEPPFPILLLLLNTELHVWSTYNRHATDRLTTWVNYQRPSFKRSKSNYSIVWSCLYSGFLYLHFPFGWLIATTYCCKVVIDFNVLLLVPRVDICMSFWTPSCHRGFTDRAHSA
jgi:hypothetical protein